MPIISHKGKDYDAPVYDVQDNSSATTLDAAKIPTGRTITAFVEGQLETKADNEFTGDWIDEYNAASHTFTIDSQSTKSVEELISDNQSFLNSILADITNWKVSNSTLTLNLPDSYSTTTHNFDMATTDDYQLSQSLSVIQTISNKLVTAVNDHATWITSSYYTKSEVNNLISALETKIDWKEAVATYNDIATTYPNPEDGWTVNVKDTDYTYRYSGSKWVAISANAIPEATTSVNGLMTTAMVTKLNGIAAGAQVNTITGIKGNAESTYRTGNVNLTPANIGALASNGTAVAATKATQDGDGNTISTTYMKKGVDYVTAGQKSGTTLGSYATAEGFNTTASRSYSHAEGYTTKASQLASHAEGYNTTASGGQSHAEGKDTTASEGFCHAEGYNTTASNVASHAEGYVTTASGKYSHAEGYYTIATGQYQHVEGIYNVSDTNNTYAHIIGGGTSESARKNIFTVDWNGDVCAGRSNGLTNDLKLPTGADVISYLNSNLAQYISATSFSDMLSKVNTINGVAVFRVVGNSNTDMPTTNNMHIGIIYTNAAHTWGFCMCQTFGTGIYTRAILGSSWLAWRTI